MKAPRPVKVIQGDVEKPIPIAVIAADIKAISEGIRKLRSGPLNDAALVLLIQNAAPMVGGKYNRARVGVQEIRAVLMGIEDLERTYLKGKRLPL